MTKNRINQEMVEEVLPTGTTADSNPYEYGKVEAKKTEKKLYTQAELDEAVKAAKEKAAIVCEKLSYIGLDYTPLDCAEAIRKSKD